MAYEYQSFATLGVNLNRQNYGSLDISQVFNSQADLNYYTSKGAVTEGVSQYWLDTVPYPYAGQYLALVVDGEVTAYILSEKADGTFECNEVGKAPVGDGHSIVVDEEGVVSIKGFDAVTAAEDKFLPRVKWVAEVPAVGEEGAEDYVPAVPAHAEIEWVSVSAVVEGDGNTITKVTSEDGSVSVTETKGENDTVTYDLSITHPAAPEYAIRKEDRAEGATAETYHLTKDGTDVEVAIVVPDAYDDTDVTDRLDGIDEWADGVDNTLATLATKQEVTDGLALKANAADVYTKDEADGKFAVQATTLAGYGITDAYTKTETEKLVKDEVAAADHLKRKIYTLAEIQSDIEANKPDVDQYVYMVLAETSFDQDKYDEYMVIDGKIEKVGSWEVDLSDYVTTGALSTALAGYYTKGEVDGLIAPLATKEALAATNEEVGKKANSADVYTKDEVDGLVEPLATKEEVNKKADAETVNAALALKADADKVYTKDEANALLDDKANAADVYTKDEADDLLDAKANADAVYTKDEADALLAKKIESGSIAHSTETVAEGVTVEGTKLNIVVDAYTKEETLTKIAEKITEINGGESAGEVLSQLNSYKETNNAAVGAINEKLATVANGAEVNVINSVNADEFVIKSEEGVDRQLNLVAVPVGKIAGLNADEFAYNEGKTQLSIAKVPVAKIDGFGSEFEIADSKLQIKAVSATKLTDLNTAELAISNGKLGIVAVDVAKVTGLADNYVAKANYAVEVGDISKLVHASGKADSTIVDEINDINTRLTWQEMSV